MFSIFTFKSYYRNNKCSKAWMSNKRFAIETGRKAASTTLSQLWNRVCRREISHVSLLGRQSWKEEVALRSCRSKCVLCCPISRETVSFIFYITFQVRVEKRLLSWRFWSWKGFLRDRFNGFILNNVNILGQSSPIIYDSTKLLHEWLNWLLAFDKPLMARNSNFTLKIPITNTSKTHWLQRKISWR